MRRDHLFEVHHGFHRKALPDRQLVGYPRCDHVFDWSVFDDLLQFVEEKIHDDNGRDAAVGKLVAHFPRRVEWVRVDTDDPDFLCRQKGYGELQDIRQHDGHAVALFQAEILLKIGREPGCKPVQLPVGQCGIHGCDRRIIGKTEACRLDFCWNVFGLGKVQLGRGIAGVVVCPVKAGTDSGGNHFNLLRESRYQLTWKRLLYGYDI